jgi:hypothetical protein
MWGNLGRDDNVSRRTICFKQAEPVPAPAASSFFDSIKHLECVYPGFDAWFHGKVIPGLRDGSRKLFLESAAGRVAGLAIAKRTSTERKLCTLWVAREARNHGLAARLADEAFDWLGTTKPLFTVPDIRIEEFTGLLTRWEFVETQIVEDIYRRTSREFVFNGLLCPLS